MFGGMGGRPTCGRHQRGGHEGSQGRHYLSDLMRSDFKSEPHPIITETTDSKSPNQWRRNWFTSPGAHGGQGPSCPPRRRSGRTTPEGRRNAVSRRSAGPDHRQTSGPRSDGKFLPARPPTSVLVFSSNEPGIRRTGGPEIPLDEHETASSQDK
jgi:hypothetical protein